MRFLGLTPAPIVADLDWVALGALLAQVCEDKLVGLSALLMRHRRVAEATTTVPYFRASCVLLKGNALTALTAFSESALRVLEYLFGYSEDRRDNETGESLAGSPEWGPEAGSAGPCSSSGVWLWARPNAEKLDTLLSEARFHPCHTTEQAGACPCFCSKSRGQPRPLSWTKDWGLGALLCSLQPVRVTSFRIVSPSSRQLAAQHTRQLR